MTASTTNRGRALVVGLGIAGIATAIRLRQIGWEPVIVERAPARRGGGYFIGLFGAGRSAAQRLGVLEHLHNRDGKGVVYDIDRQGNRRVGMSFGDLPGVPWMALRGDVEAAAYAALPDDVEIRYSTVPAAITQDTDGVDVTLTNTTDDGVSVTERFDLVVGADGLRSTVRKLVFGPHEEYLRRLGHIIAAFELPSPLSDLALTDGVSLIETGRTMMVYPFADHAPTALISYRTDDVDAEFREPPAARLRAVFGPQPLGRTLTEVLDAFDNAEHYLFDSVEQVHLDSWHRGRVVLVGDSAWCETLYSGMGVSSALAGPDLLGTMLAAHPGDIETALTDWEAQLRPHMDFYQELGFKQRLFFTPDNYGQLLLRKGLTRLRRTPVIGPILTRARVNGKAGKAKDLDIAAPLAVLDDAARAQLVGS
jgi:2-polyprenyl-6-methoxyphenol hydroxylase-like FAD-dependent oxidoreductase